jgi:uncharacterized protein YgbK (DUF1537 family)
MLLGCIADDFTGATDLANSLARQGLGTLVSIGVPKRGLEKLGIDSLVVALKSRTIAAPYAVEASLHALRALRNAKAQQYYFKYCSTFDSTDAGNIGPVADAMLAELGESFTVACPAYPIYKRTVYGGYLFAGDKLLSESEMRDHPLTPMTDSSLVRVLSRQTQGTVNLIPYPIVDRGSLAVRKAMMTLKSAGSRYAIVDALSEDHLSSIGAACKNLKLVTGGSALARALAENFKHRKKSKLDSRVRMSTKGGHSAVLAGSCSPSTQGQVMEMRKFRPSFSIDPLRIARGADVASEVLEWAAPRLSKLPLLIYSSKDAHAVQEIQSTLGRNESSGLIEKTFGVIATGLVALGVRNLVVAGGETSGAVVSALGVDSLRIEDEIEPGVPWTLTLGDPPMALALKSGNFGGRHFFRRAFEVRP